MRRTFILPAIAAALTAVTLGAASASADQPARNVSNDCADRNSRGNDLQVVGLVADGTLVCFEEDRPRRAETIGRVRGLVQDTSLIGIDYRPANNTLYGVGNTGGIYTINAANARAKLVSRLNQPLAGTSFGVDFNPAVDRLRIVSDTGQNLRANVDDGTTTPDGTLNIPGTPPVSPALGVTAVAYTNNDADPNTVTTLFDIDTTNDNVVIQAPANAGSLSPTGKLGVDAAGPVGFDIYTSLYPRDPDERLQALASIVTPDGKTNLYDIDLLSGWASPVGTFWQPVVDIAIPTDQR